MITTALLKQGRITSQVAAIARAWIRLLSLAIVQTALAVSLDTNTLFLLHLENTAVGASGQKPSSISGITYLSAVSGNGGLFTAATQLYFPVKGNLDATRGTLEFWIKPSWSGNDGVNHTLLRQGVDGGLIVLKDGANNLRIILNRFGAGGKPELGVSYNIGAWTSNSWHHVAFTWGDGFLQVYTDGLLRSSSSIGALPVVPEPLFQIGAAGTGEPAMALLDEMRISSRPRTAAEIATSFAEDMPTEWRPAIVEQPKPMNVARGGLLTAHLSFTGTPLPKIIWLKDGVEIPGQTNATLSFVNAETNNTAFYQAVVTNSFGSAASRIVSLSVNVPGSEMALRPRGVVSPTNSDDRTVSAGAVVIGSYLYTVGSSGFLQAFDVSDADKPRQVASLSLAPGWGCFDMACYGQYAFVACRGLGLAIVNLSNPLNPTLVRYLKTPGYLANAIRIEGNTAFVGNEDVGLLIVDVSNPEYPTVLSSIKGQGTQANGVFVRGSTVFVAEWSKGAFAVDASHLKNPSVIGVYGGSGLNSVSFGVSGLGDAVYLSDYNGGGNITVVDWRDSSKPVTRSRFQGGGYGMQIVGSYLCVGDTWISNNHDRGVRWFDIHDPLQPVPIGLFKGFEKWGVGTTVVKGNRMYTIGGKIGVLDLDFEEMSPAITTPPTGGRVPLGSTFQLDVAAVGTEPLSYQWLKDGKPLPGATNDVLKLQQTFLDDVGFYSVSITNAFGSVQSKPVSLTVPSLLQTISWDQDTLNTMLPWNQSVSLTATSSSGLPVTYELISGRASLASNRLTPTVVGSVVVEVQQAGDSQFLAARPLQRQLTFVVPPRFTELSATADGGLRFRMNGPAGTSAVLQFSTNLATWLPVSTNTLPATLNSPLSTNSTDGFYRLLLQ